MGRPSVPARLSQGENGGPAVFQGVIGRNLRAGWKIVGKIGPHFLGNRVETVILRANWTRTAVAAALRVTPRTLYNWEREGKIPPPERDERGWRRYTEAHVEELRRLLGAPEPASPREEYRMEAERAQ